MDLAQLRAFVAVAELKHFGRAAERLNITQPALTKRLRGLEATVGAQLFKRNRRGTALTSTGEALLGDAVKLTADADSWLTRARNAGNGMAGHLNLGFGLSSIAIAPQIVARFRRAYPAVDISLNDFSSAEQLKRLQDGSLDVGFVRLPTYQPSIASYSLASDSLALAVPPDGSRPSFNINFEALNEIGFIMLDRERGPGLRKQIDVWCEASNFQPNVIQVADDIQTVLALVAAGVGVSIVPHQATRLVGDLVTLIPLNDKHGEWEVGVAWRSKADNPSISPFLNLIGL